MAITCIEKKGEIMGRKEFTVGNVIDMIEAESPPTPMDKEHDAVWWNSNFGLKIKDEFQEMKDRLIGAIEQMTEY